MVEALLLVVAAAAAPLPAAVPDPDIELLEFIGDWSPEEGGLIDAYEPSGAHATDEPAGKETDDAPAPPPS